MSNVSMRLRTDEIDVLTEQYGAPKREHFRLGVGPSFFTPWEKKFRTRQGEVMFLLPRPGGLLIHRKAHYPPGTFRLLTGGIERGERVEQALRREVREEVGYLPAPQRFVALLTYEIVGNSQTYPFATYIFLMAYSDAPLRPSVDDEIEETRVASLETLPRLAHTLRTLPGDWNDWGRFRAHAHELVAGLIAPEEVTPPS